VEPLNLRNKSQTVICSKDVGTMRKHIEDSKTKAQDQTDSLWLFSKCWEVLKEDIMEVFKEFHSIRKFEKSFNATFVSLIPKKAGAVDIKDFRPIRLVGGVYKIISKVLTHRLKLVLGKSISSSQNAFIKGRQILNSFMVASECLDTLIRSREPGVLCKLNLEKAYDHINWVFL